MNIASLFMVGFEGITVPDALQDLLRAGLGGVILFKRNIASLPQLRDLTAELRGIAQRPLLIGVDHEGGRVFRLPKPFTQVPPLRTLGHYAKCHSDGPVLAFQIAKMMATELAAVGINVNFAPVLDINTNLQNPIIGDRAFGADRDLVTALGRAMVRGCAEGGVAACGKHFPGHGDTGQDSHLTLPTLPHTWDRLRQFELAPFAAAIKEGVPMIMPGHLLYGAIDAANPIPFSERAIHGLLREEMHFNGVIVTDDLEMGALKKICPLEDAAVRSLRAGCDLAMICRDTAAAARAIQHVEAAVTSGQLDSIRLEQSTARIASLSARYANPSPPPPSCVGSDAHQALISKLIS